MLIQAAALIQLWSSGFVEPIEPPPLPFHVLAQQLMALVLQESGIGRQEWFDWIAGVHGFGTISREQRLQLVSSMLDKEILWDDSGILGMGREGEQTFGRKNFLELLSVFMSPPLFSVLHGRNELGYVDEMTFLGKEEGPRILLLGGRAWKVNHIDWPRRRAYVEPTESKGRTRWKGEGQGLEYQMSQAIKHVLATDDDDTCWSRRASDRIKEIRHEYGWLQADATVALVRGNGELEWWTFGGSRANATIAHELARETNTRVRHDSFTLTFESSLKLQDVSEAIDRLKRREVAEMRPSIDEAAIDGLKFSQCLSPELAIQLLQERLKDTNATRQILGQSVRNIVGAE